MMERGRGGAAFTVTAVTQADPATSASSSIYRSFHLRVIVIVLCLIRLLLVVIRMQIFHDRP